MRLLPLFATLSLALFAVGDVFQNPIDIDSIRNTLALYPLSIDSKNFAGLALVFTPDAVANYGQPLGVLNGLSEIQQTLSTALANVLSQHSLTTQHITLLDNNNATATTYVIASEFGVGVYNGQLLTIWAKYDDLLRTNSGSWLIYDRLVTYMVRPICFCPGCRDSIHSKHLAGPCHRQRLYRKSTVNQLPCQKGNVGAFCFVGLSASTGLKMMLSTYPVIKFTSQGFGL
jgi:hypothetical protein